MGKVEVCMGKLKVERGRVPNKSLHLCVIIHGSSILDEFLIQYTAVPCVSFAFFGVVSFQTKKDVLASDKQASSDINSPHQPQLLHLRAVTKRFFQSS